jgi:hypothetical protein
MAMFGLPVVALLHSRSGTDLEHAGVQMFKVSYCTQNPQDSQMLPMLVTASGNTTSV